MTSDTVRCLFASAFLLLAACSSAEPSDTDDLSSPTSASETPIDDDGDTPDPGLGESTTSSSLPASEQTAPGGPSLEIAVTRVSDGDSLRATSTAGDLEIRLLGINAPEGDECFGEQARGRLADLVGDADQVSLHPWPADYDEFGRTLGFLTAGGVFVNLALLETGHAVARDQSDHDFAGEFEEAEAIAAGSGVGLWAPDACGPATSASVEIVELLANAPGDDRQNPNGEYVVIENTGDESVSLDGWAIRDESTRHRYSFPDIDLEPGRRARLRSGCDEDDRQSDPIELFWCDPEPPIWNNGGDTAFLLDRGGNTVDFLRS